MYTYPHSVALKYESHRLVMSHYVGRLLLKQSFFSVVYRRGLRKRKWFFLQKKPINENLRKSRICSFVESWRANRKVPLGFLRKQWYKIPFWYGALKIPGISSKCKNNRNPVQMIPSSDAIHPPPAPISNGSKLKTKWKYATAYHSSFTSYN